MRKRRRYEDEPALRETLAPVDETSEERGLSGEALRLQELIGNANATEVIARSPLQRDGTAAEAAPAKSGAEEKGGVYTMTMAEIGTFDLLSFSWGVTGASSNESGTTGKDKQKQSDLTATKKGDAKISPKLMQYAADGKHIASVEILMKRDGKTYMTITLKDAFIASYQAGSGDEALETFSLSFAEIESTFAEGEGK